MSAFKPVVKSIFSASTIFLLILSAFLSIFLLSNMSSLLTSLGFQTKEALRVELNATQTNLQKAVEVNTENANALEVEREANRQMREQIAEVTKKTVEAEKIVTVIKEKKVKRNAPVIVKVIEKTVVTEEMISLPIAEINTLSASNIEQIHEVFNALFPVT